MSHHFECIADVRDGLIMVPAEIQARLYSKGVRRVRLTIESTVEDENLLLSRGISAETVQRVAAIQHIDNDVAFEVLASEGSAIESELATALTKTFLSRDT